MRINEQTLGLGGGMALPKWLAAYKEAQVRRILRQNDVAFRWFIAGCIAVCGLIVAAMFLT